VHDQAYIYPNYNHGFVDPFTGILIWIGFFSVFIKFIRKNRSKDDLLFLTGFLLLWMLFTFVVNKNPNYTRMLTLLPFVAFFVVSALIFISTLTKKLFHRLFPNLEVGVKPIVFSLGLVVIIYWNLFIFGDFVKKGLIEGNDLGGSLRYIENRKDNEKHVFYLVYHQHHDYISKGWDDWFSQITGDRNRVKVISKDNMIKSEFSRPFTVFMWQDTWFDSKKMFMDKFPDMKMYHIVKDSSFIALEVN